ncbi:MAG: hypothetical protein WCG93_06010 [Paludibacter sp.]
MKTKLLFLSFFMFTAFVSRAQDIAVQAPDNSTIIYHDLNKAIYYAPSGSTVFLPAGPLSISDTTLIKKTLNIIGVGHRSDTEGGNTVVNGNLNYRLGSDGSSLMGIYLSGNVNIADANGAVNNFLLKFCNVNYVQVGSALCNSIIINQNYVRISYNGGNSPIQFTNNLTYSITDVNGGLICNNIIWCSVSRVNSTLIRNNIFLQVAVSTTPNCISINNMFIFSDFAWGNNSIYVTNWNDIFIKCNLSAAIDPICNYHFKSNIGKNAGTDGTDIGIYGGTGFSDTALPPYPQIVFKNIPAQTDEFGNLKIQVKVKAQ